MEIRWKSSFSASCVHAVLSRERGFAGVDRELAEIIAEPAEILKSAIAHCHLPVLKTLAALGNLASEYDNNRQLVEISLVREFGLAAAKVEWISHVAAALGGLETKFLAARPRMVDELALRARPLQQQWHARGHGLIRQMASLSAEDFITSAAEVVLVMPWVGGFGRADLKTNRAIFEAVMADPNNDLPEALRLGWLLAQLQADLPKYGDPIGSGALCEIAQMAAVPLVLAAAESVEWSQCSMVSIERALECWHIVPGISAQERSSLAEKLFGWWKTYQTGNSTWEVAWRSLEPLLR